MGEVVKEAGGTVKADGGAPRLEVVEGDEAGDDDVLAGVGGNIQGGNWIGSDGATGADGAVTGAADTGGGGGDTISGAAVS